MEDRPDRDEGQLEHRKRQREEEPPASAASSTFTTKQPITALPLIERRPPPSAAFLEATAVARVETSHERSYFRRDPEKVDRARHNDPHFSPMVLDFLTSNAPRDPSDVPSYVSRTITSLPKAWTTDLHAVARRRNPDAMQAVFALTLQAATMAAQAAREAKNHPSMACLQAELEAAWKTNAEFADMLMVMEKNSLDAAKKVK
ncbi:hypothetical protein OROHE_015690 [Orobanche hederae]